MAKKVEDNILHMVTATVIVPQPTAPQDPAANPPHTLLKAPNALVIKYICMPMGNLKAVKLWSKPAKA